MKLSASYNAFDGLDVLEKSILSISDSVDFISVVWQDISNNGNLCNEKDLSILKNLYNSDIINKIIEFTPNIKQTPHQNELAKRNLGLSFARERGYTHHLNIDCDELYIKSQFDHAKKMIESNDYEATACKMKTYYKYPNCIIVPAEEYYVPFIHKITNRNYELSTKWSILADPTRKIPCKNPYSFNRLDLEMHHLSYVREDLRSKLENSSANANFKNKIDSLIESYNNFKIGEKCVLAGKENRVYSTCQTKNIYDLIG